MQNIKVAKTFKNAILPTRKNPIDAGVDLYSMDNHIIPPHLYWIFHTGVAVEIPEGYVGLVWPKSRQNALIGGGVIDAGYSGEILVKLFNMEEVPLEVKRGDAIAQLLVQPIVTPQILNVEREELYAEKKLRTVRGSTGGIVTQLGE